MMLNAFYCPSEFLRDKKHKEQLDSTLLSRGLKSLPCGSQLMPGTIWHPTPTNVTNDIDMVQPNPESQHSGKPELAQGDGII
jgi:hypothetical protein